jgi:hypothetical protein
MHYALAGAAWGIARLFRLLQERANQNLSFDSGFCPREGNEA